MARSALRHTLPPGGLIVRPLRPGDSLAELTALLHRAYRPLAEQGMQYLASHQDEAKTRERIDAGECWVAVLDGRLAGTVTLKDAARTKGCSWYDRPEVASFGQFAVEPDLQGRGIGGALLAAVEKSAADKGVRDLALDTAETAAGLIAMYTRHGYRFIEHVTWTGVTNYRSVVMSKTLPCGHAGPSPH